MTFHKIDEEINNMGKVAEYVMDFLALVGEHEEYDKYNWGWDNLPSFEKMVEITNKHYKGE